MPTTLFNLNYIKLAGLTLVLLSRSRAEKRFLLFITAITVRGCESATSTRKKVKTMVQAVESLKRISYYLMKLNQYNSVHHSKKRNQYRYNRLLAYKRAMDARLGKTEIKNDQR